MSNTIILITNRLLKVLGALVKGFSYFFHFIFKNKRFTLPKYSKALMKSKNSKIPKIIWQTNYTNNVSLPVYINYLVNRLMSLDYEYRYSSNEDCLELIEKYGSQKEIESYKKLRDGAAKADFWRVFALYKVGGVYLDIDAHAVFPLSFMIKNTYSEVFLLNKEHYTNYFMASSPNNEILEKALNIMVDNIENRNLEGGVYNLTGPVVINLAIDEKKVNHRFYRVTCNQGNFTNEYFQYIDKPRGKWTHTKKEDILKD